MLCSTKTGGSKTMGPLCGVAETAPSCDALALVCIAESLSLASLLTTACTNVGALGACDSRGGAIGGLVGSATGGTEVLGAWSGAGVDTDSAICKRARTTTVAAGGRGAEVSKDTNFASVFTLGAGASGMRNVGSARSSGYCSAIAAASAAAVAPKPTAANTPKPGPNNPSCKLRTMSSVTMRTSLVPEEGAEGTKASALPRSPTALALGATGGGASLLIRLSPAVITICALAWGAVLTGAASLDTRLSPTLTVLSVVAWGEALTGPMLVAPVAVVSVGAPSAFWP